MLLFVRIQDRHLDDRWLFPVIIQASKQVDSDNNHAEKIPRRWDAKPNKLSGLAPTEANKDKL